MADTPNFTSALDRPAEEIKRPPPLPVGTYLGIIDGMYKEREQGSVPVIDFTIKLLNPQNDVDQGAIAAQGGLNGRTVRHTIWMKSQSGEDMSYRLKEFLDQHLAISPAGKSLREMLAESPGKQVLVVLKHNPSKDGTELFANVDKTLRV